MNEELSECTLTWYRLEEIIDIRGERNVLDDLIQFLPLDKVKDFIECQTQLYELYAINE